MRGGTHLDFDGTLKEFFQQQPTSLLLELTGGVPVVEFLNVELPAVQERRLDLVMLLANETLLHLELQSSNDRDMALRMLEYYTLLWRRYRKPVGQVVLYVGTPRMRMVDRLESESLRYRYSLRDVREWRAEELLASSLFGDQVLAILGGTSDAPGVVHGVLERIVGMAPERRERALRYVLNLAGLRKFGIIVAEEVKRMGVTVDWSQYPAVQEIAKDSEARGEARGVRKALLFLLKKRFGALPGWAVQKVDEASEEKAMAWLAKAGDAATLAELIPRR
jgi:predicted transposase YdaD